MQTFYFMPQYTLFTFLTPLLDICNKIKGKSRKSIKWNFKQKMNLKPKI